MTIPPEWVLASFGGLAAVISSLAAIVYKSLSSEIANLRGVVKHMQDDVDRLSKGCGMTSCVWKNR